MDKIIMTKIIMTETTKGTINHVNEVEFIEGQVYELNKGISASLIDAFVNHMKVAKKFIEEEEIVVDFIEIEAQGAKMETVSENKSIGLINNEVEPIPNLEFLTRKELLELLKKKKGAIGKAAKKYTKAKIISILS